jgi:hypothetical protein
VGTLGLDRPQISRHSNRDFARGVQGPRGEWRLNHSAREAEKFYRERGARALRVRVGMEAIGHSRRFERLLAKLRIEAGIGDAAGIFPMSFRSPENTESNRTQYPAGLGE